MTFMMADAAFGGRVVRRVNDPQIFLMADFRNERGQFILELFAEALERIQKRLAVVLQLFADFFALLGRGRIFEFDEQQILFHQIFVPRLIEADDQGFYVGRCTAKIPVKVFVIVRHHDDGRCGGLG